MTTSAAYLKLVSDYTGKGLIATYGKFVTKRGVIKSYLYSDCGTHFVGAQKELKLL